MKNKKKPILDMHRDSEKSKVGGSLMLIGMLTLLGCYLYKKATDERWRGAGYKYSRRGVHWGCRKGFFAKGCRGECGNKGCYYQFIRWYSKEKNIVGKKRDETHRVY